MCFLFLLFFYPSTVSAEHHHDARAARQKLHVILTNLRNVSLNREKNANGLRTNSNGPSGDPEKPKVHRIHPHFHKRKRKQPKREG